MLVLVGSVVLSACAEPSASDTQSQPRAWAPAPPAAPLPSSLTAARARAEQLCQSAALDQLSRTAYAASVTSSRIYGGSDGRIVIEGMATGTSSRDLGAETRFVFRCQVRDGVVEALSVERPRT